MRVAIRPYRAGSQSARNLAAAMPRGRVLRLEGSSFRPRPADLIINWGNTEASNFPRMLNPPEVIRNASNKRTFFQRMHEDPDGASVIPEFWTRRADIPADAYPIVCRTVLSGHSGQGIVMADTVDQLVDAPLYVRYIKKQSEYRVHVGKLPNGEILNIAVQKKVKRADAEDVDFRIRNHANGFIFQRQGIEVPPQVFATASIALRVSGLDFGAVDVIYNARQGRAYVLEVNTAPGLEGQTVTDYQTFFNNYRSEA